MTHFPDPISMGPRGAKVRPARYGRALLLYVPPTLDRDGFCAAQQRTGAGNLTLNGALVRADGRGYVDWGLESFGRAVGAYSAGDLSAVAFTFYGYDFYRQPLVEVIGTGPNNSTVSTDKAFWTLTRVTTSATIGSDVEIGTVDKFGLPLVLKAKNRLARVGWDDVAAENAATFVVADATSPATSTTGDPRGTVVPSSASNGTRELCIEYLYDDTSKLTRLGVAQYGAGLV